MEWKKVNGAPLHKKNDKESVKCYRPIFLLPICGKISEYSLYNSLFNFLTQNKLISNFSLISLISQSGFKPGDSCINQLLSLTP